MSWGGRRLYNWTVDQRRDLPRWLYNLLIRFCIQPGEWREASLAYYDDESALALYWFRKGL